jgi:hypothetical protein
MPWLLYSWKKAPRYPLNRKLHGFWSHSTFLKREKVLFLPHIKPLTFQPIAWSVFTVDEIWVVQNNTVTMGTETEAYTTPT